VTFEKLVLERQPGIVYGPDTLKAMTEAFDLAWCEIGRFYSQHPLQEEIYRARLAHAVLQATKPHRTRPEDIKNEALTIFPNGANGLRHQ
jgi:hypothetical protein